MTVKHPAVFSDKLLPIIAEIAINHSVQKVLDPFAGTGKLALIKELGFRGTIDCVEIEREWASTNLYSVDNWYVADSANMYWAQNESYDAICTSTVYGNRLSDHHNAQDGSKRISYKHFLGRDLTEGNTGQMQWGDDYRRKHEQVYLECLRVLKYDGIFILNISDHIRKGEIMPVSLWHRETLEELGLTLIQEVQVETPRMKFGKNAELRVKYENIFVFKKYER